MKYKLKACLLVLCMLLLKPVLGWGSEAIAVWAYPDSNVVSGAIHVGVVAYHSSGINRVMFSIDNGNSTSVEQETLNPETNEYEFVFPIDTTELSDDVSHTVRAVAYPNSGELNTLPGLIIQVDNSPEYNTWYVDTAGDDVNGDGSAENPFRTIGRALGTEWAVPDPHARSGDTVLLREGTYALAQGQHAEFTKHVTIRPDGNADVKITGGVLRSAFMKFIGIDFVQGGVTAYKDHIWIKDCTYTGYGQIWPDTINVDEAFRSRNTNDYINPGHAIVENYTVHDANQGISVIAQGNSIIRNCHVYNQNGDAMKFMGENVLITGNKVHNVGRPAGWSISKNNGPFNFGDDSEFTVHISTTYGSTWDSRNIFRLSLSGDGLTAQDVVNQLNANSQFNDFDIRRADTQTYSTYKAGFTAQISESPYPYTGNVIITLLPNMEQFQFYVEGPVNDSMNFSDNSRNLNDISLENPAKNSTDHNDFMANDDRDAKNVIIRNNKIYDISSQGLKFDGIARNGEEYHVYKKNIAIVNNQITGADGSARHMYFNYRGSGRSYIHYENFLLAHNTVFRSENVYVRSVITISLDNPDIKDFVVKNNIIGEYSNGDWKLFDNGQGMSDYNLFFPSQHTQLGVLLNNNSVEGEPFFVNTQEWNFGLNSGSPAIGIADPDCGIAYDLLWRWRSENPEAGAYEFDPVEAPLYEPRNDVDEQTDGEIPQVTVLKCFNNIINPGRGDKATIIVELSKESNVSIIIYDSKGNKVIKLVDENKQPDIYTYYWAGEKNSGGTVGSGVYIVHIKAGECKETKKIAVIK